MLPLRFSTVVSWRLREVAFGCFMVSTPPSGAGQTSAQLPDSIQESDQILSRIDALQPSLSKVGTFTLQHNANGQMGVRTAYRRLAGL